MTNDLHPRPQLTRANWTDLNGPWDFAHDDGDIGLSERWFERPVNFPQRILVPFPPESAASGLLERGFHRVLWYRRDFDWPMAERSSPLRLHFGAVDYRARVWVNGTPVAEHEGGHTPFHADIGHALANGETQTIVVRVEDDPKDLAQPRGKQDWDLEPHAIFYHRTSGIWQTVWLEPLPQRFVESLRWTTDAQSGRVGVRVKLNRASTPVHALRVTLEAHGQVFIEDTCRIGTDELNREFQIDPVTFQLERHRLVWSPESPNLLEAMIELLDSDGNVIDRVHSYLGLRSVGLNAGRFTLNNSPYYLRLVLAQNYWPESHLAAPSPEALRLEVERTKSLGFNGVRIHQKVEDPRFLYWCDRLGLLVWGEMANAYVFTPESQTRLVREWLEVIERDASHPCIVTWVPINESWGVPNLEGDAAQRNFVRSLYYLTKSLDPSRPVIGNDGWEFLCADILGIHDYADDGETLRARYATEDALEQTLGTVQPSRRNFFLDGHRRSDQPVMLTEFGGLSLRPEDDELWWGYGAIKDHAGLLEKLEELFAAVLASSVITGFCYTQLTDTEQEQNGLLRADRTPKLEPEMIRGIVTRVSSALQHDTIGNNLAQADERHRQLLEATDAGTHQGWPEQTM